MPPRIESTSISTSPELNVASLVAAPLLSHSVMAVPIDNAVAGRLALITGASGG